MSTRTAQFRYGLPLGSTPVAADRLNTVPVILLTGFLGSGKTTLLNRLLVDPAWADSAVLVNEFGDIGLDHVLVAQARDGVVLMDAGCLCCSVLGSLPATLADLYRRRARREIPMFRRLIIETSGLAEPGPILRTLMRDPIASGFYRPQGLVCTVDAVFGLSELDQHHEAVAQIALADRLLITKADLTANGQPPVALIQRLTALNPTARIVTVAPEGGVAALFAAAQGAPWMDPPALDAPHDHHAHTSDVSSESFVLEGALTAAALNAWTDHLHTRYGADLLRAKGLFNIAGLAGPVAAHGVQGVFDTVRQATWPDAERRSRIVLIGRGLVRDELARSLDILKAAPPSH